MRVLRVMFTQWEGWFRFQICNIGRSDPDRLNDWTDGYGGARDSLAALEHETPEVLTKPVRAALTLQWLDLVIVDGRKFQRSADYRARLSENQPDPVFFLNIASDVLRYEGTPGNGKWVREGLPIIFSEFSGLRAQLLKTGAVADVHESCGRLVGSTLLDDLEGQGLEEELYDEFLDDLNEVEKIARCATHLVGCRAAEVDPFTLSHSR